MKRLVFYLFLLVLNVNIFAQLNGTYTVGAGGDFATPNDAIEALKTQGISGNVTISILPGTYDLSDTIGYIEGTSFSQKVTFTSSTGNRDDVILQHIYSDSLRHMLVIDSATHLIFSDLTFNPVGFYKAIEVTNTRDLSILNCKFYCDTSAYAYPEAYIYHYSLNENQIDSILTIQNCDFINGSLGIRFISTISSKIYNVNISNNNFYNQGFGGITLDGVVDTTRIYNNYVYSDVGTIYFGLEIDYTDNYVLISHNKIYLKSQHYKVFGIAFGNSDVNNDIQVFNNLVYVSTTRNTNNEIYALKIYNGSSQNDQFNTLIVKGGETSAPLYFRFDASNFKVLNNNLVNLGGGYVFRSYDTHDPTNEISVFDYNNCYTEGEYYCRWVGNDYTYEEFMSATSNSFLNHITEIPSSFYVTDSDYAVSCESLAGTGIANPAVTVDYNNVLRPDPPTVGAIEYQDTSIRLIDALWTEHCDTASNDFSLINVTDTNYTNIWTFGNDTLGENIFNYTLNIYSSNWMKVNLNANDCILSDSIFLSVFSLPVVDLGNDTTLCYGDSLILDAGYSNISYLWNTGDTTQTIAVTDSGSYFVFVTDPNGCQNYSDTINVSFEVCEGISENSSPMISIYPNPAHDNLQISVNDYEGSIKLQILNISGEIVKSYEIRDNKEVIDISDLSDGIYFIGINDKVVKFIKK